MLTLGLILLSSLLPRGSGLIKTYGFHLAEALPEWLRHSTNGWHAMPSTTLRDYCGNPYTTYWMPAGIHLLLHALWHALHY